MVAAEGDLLEGKRITERFRIKSVEKWIDQIVFCSAEDLARHDTVFLVLIESVAIKNPLALKKHLELRAKNCHINLTEIIDYGDTTDGDFFIAIKKFGNTYLSQQAGRAVSLKAAAGIIDQIIDAELFRKKLGLPLVLPYPQRISVEDFGKSGVSLKIIDLDLAAIEDLAIQIGAELSEKDRVAYKAPELIKAGSVEESALVYSLACLFHQLITGRLPFESDDIVELQSQHLCMEPPRLHVLRPDLYFPPEVEEFLRKSLQKAPEKRFSGLLTFKTAMKEAIQQKKPASKNVQRYGRVAALLTLLASGVYLYSSFSPLVQNSTESPAPLKVQLSPVPGTGSLFQSLPPVPANAINLGSIHLLNDESRELKSGDYYCSELVLEGNAHLFARDNVQLWIKPKNGQSTQFSLKDNAVLESNSESDAFKIYYLSTSDITMAGRSKLKAAVLAPASALHAKDNAFIDGPITSNGQILAQHAHFKHIEDD